MAEVMSYGAESCLININWDALVAIGTIALAAVTVFISFRSERKIDARIRDREHRDSVGLAMAFQQEIHRVWTACEYLVRHSAADKLTIGFLEDVVRDRSRFSTPSIGDNLSSLGCFPKDIVLSIAGAHSMAASLFEMLNVPSGYVRKHQAKVSSSWTRIAQDTMPQLAETFDKLRLLTGRGKPLVPKPMPSEKSDPASKRE